MKTYLHKILLVGFIFLLIGCAGPRLPLTETQILDVQSTQLQDDEALVVVQLRYVSIVGGGVLNFHYDGQEEVRSGVFVRSPENWTPMFSIHASHNGKALLYRVKAGRLSWTQFNRGMYIGDLQQQLNTYVKPKAITYIGDVHVNVDSTNTTLFTYSVTEDGGALETIRNQYPKLVAKYPLLVNLLKKDL